MTQPLHPPRTWDVLLIGGASGTGKTSVSYRLARHCGVGITEVDDFQVMLERITTPEIMPALHHWNTHPDPMAQTAEEMFDNLIAISREMAVGLEAVIANHLETQMPLVLEGDFILPELAAQTCYLDEENNGRVRGVFPYEADEAQIIENFLQREPEHGKQTKRAHVSWLYGQWLKQSAEKLGTIALPARPWDSLFERILDLL